MIRVTAVILLILSMSLITMCSLAVKAHATHRSFVWDRNADTDEVIDYRVYKCAVSPCSPSGTLLATIPQTATGVIPKSPVPHEQRNFACVTARNADGESVCSNTIPFGTPGSPGNFRKEP